MTILAPVKRVADFNVKVRVKSDNTGVDLAKVTSEIGSGLETLQLSLRAVITTDSGTKPRSSDLSRNRSRTEHDFPCYRRTRPRHAQACCVSSAINLFTGDPQ